MERKLTAPGWRLLDDIFVTGSSVKALRALHELPRGLPVSGREVARRADISHPSATKALERLSETGLVKVSRSLFGEGYELNPEHILARDVSSIFQKETALADKLVSLLQQWVGRHSDKLEWAALFGSAAWGESVVTSDVDLAIASRPKDLPDLERALDELDRAVRDRFGSRVNPLIATSKQQRKSQIWKRIEKEGVHLGPSNRVDR